MGLESQNPQYSLRLEEWSMMRDLYKGERAVKAKTTTYLPPTAGMTLDGMELGKPGRAAYDAYLMRAVFPDFVKEATEMLIGLLHQKPPQIELPDKMESLRGSATVNGESLEMLLRRINEEQIVTGRLGIMADLPAVPGDAAALPYIAIYIAEAINNWDDDLSQGLNSLNLVVLNESGYERRDDFLWEVKEKFRVLQLGLLNENEVEGTYSQGVFDSKTFNEAGMSVPMYLGNSLKEIPFVFINAKDIVPETDEPPLVGLGRLCLTIYRGEADYRQNLYMQGQDTLITIGGVRNAEGVEGVDTEAIRTGAGSRIDLDMGGDAKYIGVSSQGLSEQRQALAADKQRAEVKASQLISNVGSSKESGEALKTRMAAQTATLNQLALAGAAGLEKLLRTVAIWVGADPEKVKVTPNTEFTNFEMAAQEFVYLMTGRTMGLPISKESIHALLVERGLSKMDFESEMALIEQEDAEAMPAGNDTVEGVVSDDTVTGAQQ